MDPTRSRTSKRRSPSSRRSSRSSKKATSRSRHRSSSTSAACSCRASATRGSKRPSAASRSSTSAASSKPAPPALAERSSQDEDRWPTPFAAFLDGAPRTRSTQALDALPAAAAGLPGRRRRGDALQRARPAASGCGRCWCSPRAEARRAGASARSEAAARDAGAAGRLRARADSHLLAHPRRPAGDGQRHAAARPADAARRARRRHGDPRRRRAAGRSVPPARARAARRRSRRSWRASCACSRSSPTRRAPAGHGRRPGDRPAGGGPGAAASASTLDADGLRDMHARKTGALIRASAAAGAIMAGADDALVAALDRYGRRARPRVSDRRRHPRRRGRSRRRSARPPARTPRPASRPIRRSSASTARARWPPSAIDRADAALDDAGLRDSRLARHRAAGSLSDGLGAG